MQMEQIIKSGKVVRRNGRTSRVVDSGNLVGTEQVRRSWGEET